MTRYQLAKLVDWAGCLQSRKRLQKVVYLLQSAGCPLEAEYILHLYGPYSEEVARLADEMARTSVVTEESSSNGVGTQYSYRLPDTTKNQLQELEATDQGRVWAAQLGPFEAMAKELLAADPKRLEYASTVVFFRNQGHDEDAAVEKTAAFKKVTAAVVRDALPLARKAFDR